VLLDPWAGEPEPNRADANPDEGCGCWSRESNPDSGRRVVVASSSEGDGVGGNEKRTLR
jgi:hypothetical protein